jgi:flagellar motor switch protein FliM
MAIASLDFSQPTKFTTEIRRRIGDALEPFCEELGEQMAKELSSEVQVSVGDIAQRTWAEAKAQLPVDSVAVAVHERAIERSMLLSVERTLVLQALECMLGGDASSASVERHLSELDWKLAAGLLDTIVSELSSAWTELDGPELTRGAHDVEGDAGVLVLANEPTLSIAFTSTIAGQASTMSLLIPWSAVEPVAESIRGGGAGSRLSLQAPAPGPEALARGVASAHVLLRAEVGSTQMGIARLLELGPGTLVELDGHAEDGVCLFAEGISIGRGRPGRSGSRRAIKLESTGEAPVRADTYATLGRAELERARAGVAGAAEAPDGGAILSSLFVRVWAELGRTHMGIGASLELTPGAVVELDQLVDAPIELFANGLCFANGSLVVTGEGAWGVQLEQLL